MRTFTVSLVAPAVLLTAVPLLARQSPPAQEAKPTAAEEKADEGIPIADARVQKACTGPCHKVDDNNRISRISFRRTTPEGWEQTIKRMYDLNNLQIDAATAREVLKYLSNNLGLAPEEVRPAAFEVERRPTEYSYADKDTEKVCIKCHSIGRVMLQRRTKEEWELLVAMHRGVYPLSDFQAFRRMERAQADPGPDGRPPDNRHPVEKALVHLTKAFPLMTPEWSAWSANMRPPRLQGSWALSGYQTGRGPIYGRVTIAVDPSAPDQFTTETKYVYARTGQTVVRRGRAIVYTGFQWRGRSTEESATTRPRTEGAMDAGAGRGADGGLVASHVQTAPSAATHGAGGVASSSGNGSATAPAAPGSANPSPSGADAATLREALFVERDWRRMWGRWFAGAYDETGLDVTLQRTGADPMVLGASVSSLRTGGGAREVRIYGANFPATLSTADVDFGPGVKVARIVAAAPDVVTVEVEVAWDAIIGPRDLFVAGASRPAAIVVYDRIDAIKVAPQAGMARVGGANFPKQYQQFEAIGCNRGPDGQIDTKDDLNLGLVDAEWSIEEYSATFGDDDKAFVGTIDPTGLFTPNLDGPNPNRSRHRDNVGDVWVVATLPAGAEPKAAKPVRARAHLLVTVPLYIKFDQPEVAGSR